MVTNWSDGIVASVFTLVWIAHAITYSSIKADKVQYFMWRRVALLLATMIANLALGSAYVIAAIIDGRHSKNFYAQATVTTMAAYIVALAVDFPPYFKMFENSAELDFLISRRKFKVGDNRHIPSQPLRKIVLEVVRVRPYNATPTDSNFGGTIYVVGNKSYVHASADFQDAYLLGMPASSLHTLFTGHKSMQDLKIMRRIELSLLDTRTLALCENSYNIDICTFLFIAVASNEGCRESLKNWKSAASGVPLWSKDVVNNITRYINTSRRNPVAPLHLSITAQQETTLKCLSSVVHRCGKTHEHSVELAVSMMALLHSERQPAASTAIDMISGYYLQCFDNQSMVLLDPTVLWRCVTLSIFDMVPVP